MTKTLPLTMIQRQGRLTCRRLGGCGISRWLQSAGALVLVSTLAACGGGSGADNSAVTVVRSDGSAVVVGAATPLVADVADRVTILEYKVLRSTVVGITGALVPDAATLASLTTTNQRLAAGDITADLATDANRMAAPPLTQATLRTLAAAASGDTLAQINDRFAVATSPMVVAWQTDRVASRWWADKGFRLRTTFLGATDMLGPMPRLAQWSADEAGFSDGTGAAVSELSTFFDSRNRVAVRHSLALAGVWPGVTSFSGIFETAATANDLYRMPLIKITQGVERLTGIDFTADALAVGNLRLMTIRPQQASLASFTADQLASAIAQSSRLHQPGAASLNPGEMILPKVNLTVPFVADAPIKRAGVALPYDEVNANLRNLDGQGGSFAISADSAASLTISEGGINLGAHQGLVFRLSHRNIFGHGSSSVVTNVVVPTGCAGTEVWPQPDLRSFVLVLMDERNWVVAMAAVQALAGEAVVPTCVLPEAEPATPVP